MSVADQLGLQDQASELLVLADQRWCHWAATYPALTGCSGVGDLRSWLGGAGKAEADQVLHALAILAAVDGGDDLPAAAVLAWALIPGACLLASRLRSLTPERIDEIVAAQLWVQVRTFQWQRLRRVAANILADTRKGVLLDCGVTSQLERSDLTWSRTNPIDPHSYIWGYASIRGLYPPSPAQELANVLAWGCLNKVITGADRALMLCLVEAADCVAGSRGGRGASGLLANDASEAVAKQWGLTAGTVRRRVRGCIDALSAALTATGRQVPA